jgi:hypothetical protein
LAKKYEGAIVKAIIGIIVALFSATSCASIPKFDSTHKLLLIGKLKLYDSSIGNKTGTHSSGINLKITNTNTYAEYILRSDREGMIYSTSLPEGTYLLKEINYNGMINGKQYDIIYSPPKQYPKIRIIDNRVNNLGIIKWYSVVGSKSKWEMNSDFKDVNQYFTGKYSKTDWENIAWTDIPIIE